MTSKSGFVRSTDFGPRPFGLHPNGLFTFGLLPFLKRRALHPEFPPYAGGDLKLWNLLFTLQHFYIVKVSKFLLQILFKLSAPLSICQQKSQTILNKDCCPYKCMHEQEQVTNANSAFIFSMILLRENVPVDEIFLKILQIFVPENFVANWCSTQLFANCQSWQIFSNCCSGQRFGT